MTDMREKKERKEKMMILIDNLPLVIAAAAVIAALIGAIYNFFNRPTAAQIRDLKEWLKYAVVIAEKELGSGTGQLKLRMVYDMFVQKWGWMSKFISFEKFSGYIDDALEWMNKQLDTNKAVASIVIKESEE